MFLETASLGTGEFGKVVAVKSLLDGAEFAVKMTAEGRQLDDAQVKRLLLEAQVMRLIASECPSALHYHGSWVESMTYRNETIYRLYMQMELCGASLADVQRQGRCLSELDLLTILKQVRAAFTHVLCTPGAKCRGRRAITRVARRYASGAPLRGWRAGTRLAVCTSGSVHIWSDCC
jgi:serine/threonine protein kinase